MDDRIVVYYPLAFGSHDLFADFNPRLADYPQKKGFPYFRADGRSYAFGNIGHMIAGIDLVIHR